MNTGMAKGWFKSMEKVLLVVCTIGLILDAVANIFLLKNYPLWEETKGREIKELKEQNEELRLFLKELLKDEEAL